MPELPIYPERGREAPGYDLERRLAGLADVPAEAKLQVHRRLRTEAVRETLRLTGAPVEEVEEGEAPLFVATLKSLELIETSAAGGTELGIALIREVHRLSNPPSRGAFRTSDVPPQFRNARDASPRWIESRLQNLLDWLRSETGKTMFPAERMALWFPRFLEIAPFERGNFRSAHLFLSFFSCAGSYPPVSLRLEDAEAVRAEVERALLFDTFPLVQRFSQALTRSLEALEGET
ncbi:MAG: Fic family protein [Vicinamibacteria bacterium]